MAVKENDNIRVIFGLKLKQLRSSKGLSLLELSNKSGLSLSYINEIEKGKKYPKAEKIMALAKGLEVSYDSLVSLKVNKTLAPAIDVLNSSLIREFPLDIFGIESKKLIELVSNAPAKVNAFINAMIEIANNYNLKNENFYYAALRSYQVLHENYFEDLERAADDFVKQFNLPVVPPVSEKHILNILEQHYGYKVQFSFPEQHPELNKFRSMVVNKHMYINPTLNKEQRLFQLAREAGYLFMKIKDRPYTSTWIKVTSFDQVLNNFKASYFANAVLIPKSQLLADMETLFARTTWDNEAFTALLAKYQVSPETLMHRLTNLLPKHWGIHNLFFQRVNKTPEGFFIDKELHIATRHKTYSNEINLHYCRRWLSVNLMSGKTRVKSGIQQSHYLNSGDDFLIISMKVPAHKIRENDTVYSLGLLISNELRKKAAFLGDSNIPQKEVNICCERCPLTNCKERAAEPVELEKEAAVNRLEEALQAFIREEEN